MRKFKLLLEYEGTRYVGWQIQPNGLAIQQVLEEALKTITKKKVRVIGSGRTDSGVHAEGQVAHFTTASKMTPFQFMKALNSLLPFDIAALAVEEVPAEFHAQKSATGKIYRYTILNRDHPTALNQKYCWYIPHKLNLPAMRQAARYLVGRHDFSAFRATNCSAKTPVRHLRSLDVRKRGDYLIFEFEGEGFLKHMIRIIMGTLEEVGRGRRSAAGVKELLESKDRRQAGATAPAQGLTLVTVFYPASPRTPLGRKRKSAKKGG